MEHLETIKENDHIFAIVIRKDFSQPGIHFFTPGEFSQQLGMLIHPQGKSINRHRHKLVKREIQRTQEVLVVFEGKIKVDLYNDEGKMLKSVILNPGEVILLAQGGHLIEILEDTKMIEIKQGPYAGFDDKEFF